MNYPTVLLDNSILINIIYQLALAASNQKSSTISKVNFLNNLYNWLKIEYMQHNLADDNLYSQRDLAKAIKALAPISTKFSPVFKILAAASR